jgi:amino acid permease
LFYLPSHPVEPDPTPHNDFQKRKCLHNAPTQPRRLYQETIIHRSTHLRRRTRTDNHNTRTRSPTPKFQSSKTPGKYICLQQSLFFQEHSLTHTQVIALGSNIGSGLFIGTGKALAYGGPGNMLIAYLIVCFGVWANVQSLIEMTILYPTSGNFVDYAGRWVDPAIAFGAGFAEWLGDTFKSPRETPY